jgi:hypothetical protein
MRTGIVSALVFLAWGCFDEIQLDLPETDDRKRVVEGFVNQRVDSLEVFLTVGINAANDDQGESVQLTPLEEAYLIYNEVPFPQFPLKNNEITHLPLDVFESVAPSVGPPIYQLFVALPDGQRFQSEPEILPALPEAEKIDIGTYRQEVRTEQGSIVERDFVEILITTPLRDGNSEKALLRWTLQGVYRFVEAPDPISNMFDPQQTCYVEDNLSQNQILLFNGRETTVDTLRRFPVLRDVPLNHLFSTGYFVTVFQQTLSPNAFRYWNQLQQNASIGTGLFVPAPGTVLGNVKNMDDPAEQVLGFFYATQTDTIRRLIRPGEVGNPTSFCDNPLNQETDVLLQPESICSVCTLLFGSSLEQPDFWEE